MIAPTLLSVLINTILNEYFINSTCLLILTDGGHDFLIDLPIPTAYVKIKNDTVENTLTLGRRGCQDFLIIYQDSSIIVQQLEQQIKLSDDRFNLRKYLIVTDNLDIFKSPDLNYIVNLLVIKKIKDIETNCSVLSELCYEQGVFKLMTHKYVGESNNNSPVLLDYWFTTNKSFSYGNNLYPDKLRDQQGRGLRCATFNYKPYSIIGKSPSIAIGSENGITHEFVKRLNMTVHYVLDNKEWGIIHDNWTGDGVLGNVMLDKADIGYAALYTWAHEYGFLDLSKPVVRTGISCLVPAPKLSDGWLTPLLPFSLEMWLYFCISFALISVAIIGITGFLTKKKLENKYSRLRKKEKIRVNYRVIFNQSLIRITKIFLMQSVANTKKQVDVSLKYMFAVFLYSLVMTASYSSGLASVMTIPRYSGAINSVWDLANSDLNWGATQDAWIYSILEDERPQYVTIVNKFIATSEDNLLEFANSGHFAFSVERLPSGQYAIGSYITEDIVKNLRLMHDELYWEYCVFMLRKSSPLLNPLNDLILRLNEIGLIIFWEKKTTEIHMDMRVQNIVGFYRASQVKGSGKTVEKLQWVHVEGAFGILLGGYVLSIIIFLFELSYTKWMRMNRKYFKQKHVERIRQRTKHGMINFD